MAFQFKLINNIMFYNAVLITFVLQESKKGWYSKIIIFILIKKHLYLMFTKITVFNNLKRELA